MAGITHLSCILLVLLATCCTIEANEHDSVKCYRHASDVVFAIDSSFSIRSHEFDQQLSFLKRLIDTFTIGKNHIQVGVVSFGTEVRLDIGLGQFQSKKKLKLAVGKIVHMDKGTHAHLAIRYIREQIFKPANGGRPWAKKKLVLITDGLSSNPQATLQQAADARQDGIEIFGVGIGVHGEVFKAELNHVVSEPRRQHLFHVRDYKSLDTINKMLSDAACERPTGTGEGTAGSTADILKECRNNKADIVFVFDSSSSIWKPDFDKQIKFVRQVTSTFEIGPTFTRVGLVVYSDTSVVLLPLEKKENQTKEIQTREHVNHILDTTLPLRGQTNTAGAIRRARTHVLSKPRPNVPRIMVVLTDGDSEDRQKTLKEARKAHQEGIYIFAIGIGSKTDAQDLMAMATDPDDKFVFHVDSFDGLSSIKDLLVIKSCDVAADMMQGDEYKCPARPNDVVFVYDAEWLNRRQNDFIVTTISDVIESESLNTRELRFGVIREASHKVQLHNIQLTDNWKQPSFKSELDAESKKSLIYKLLYKARTQFFQDVSSEFRKRTVVLFLDSDMTDWFQAKIEAYMLNRANVEIIIVGLGTHFNKLQALNLTGHRNLIITTLSHGQSRASHSSHVGKGIIDRLCR